MIDKERNELTAVEACLKQGVSFAIYRIAGEKQVHFLRQTTGNVRRIGELKELNGQKGFVIAPFRISESSPVVLIQPEEKEQFLSIEDDMSDEERRKERDSFILSSRNTAVAPCSDAYADCFRQFVDALKCRTFDKLVLSRSLNIRRSPAFSPLAAFRMACRCYVYSYVYLCYTPQTGVWLGSTPEILLSGEKDEWNTVALAGTQPLQDGQLPQVWDEKNRKEQAYVASYIRSQLLSLGIRAAENKPHPVYAGALSHLKTDFRFSLNHRETLGELISLLHPTPAVCGLPKEEAYRFILEHEGYDRRYYSGFIGWLDPNGRTDLYVNLRCMHIGEEMLTLYAGGGLLDSSELEDEWQETEKKLQTIKQLDL